MELNREKVENDQKAICKGRKFDIIKLEPQNTSMQISGTCIIEIL